MPSLFLYGGKELWSFYQPPVQADMLSACMEYEDILSDKRRGAHPSPPKGREPDTHPQPLPKGGGQGTSTYTFRRICYPPEQKEPGIRGALFPLPKGGGQGTSTYTFRRICYPPEQKEPGIRGALSPLPWGGVGGGSSAQADNISA